MYELIYYRSYAIILIYVILFGTAAFEKFKSLRTPDWFIKQFENSFLSKIPGAVAYSYWAIAVLELILLCMFLTSIFVPMLLPVALLISLFLFAFLLFGLRLIHDYQGSANMFVYFGVSLLSLFLTRSQM